ncbi:hypothetical protein SAMN04488168_10435 [Bacillus sp. 491mf]|uniref:hypothetical protein n=1 Tax=unclassified Bacillus (in: firmicutes) TaxID=185979 RepID=UPI0008E9A144|nr:MULTISPECIES: hypothetical protein [unclassified Bacillus (in: firmicutes)]SFC36441.1 hypothetical protein SAMN04488168_10435 [Bacillus sp. 491mf]
MCNSASNGCCPLSQFVVDSICGIFDTDLIINVFSDSTGFQLATITITIHTTSLVQLF